MGYAQTFEPLRAAHDGFRQGSEQFAKGLGEKRKRQAAQDILSTLSPEEQQALVGIEDPTELAKTRISYKNTQADNARTDAANKETGYHKDQEEINKRFKEMHIGTDADYAAATEANEAKWGRAPSGIMANPEYDPKAPRGERKSRFTIENKTYQDKEFDDFKKKEDYKSTKEVEKIDKNFGNTKEVKKIEHTNKLNEIRASGTAAVNTKGAASGPTYADKVKEKRRLERAKNLTPEQKSNQLIEDFSASLRKKMGYK